MRAATDFAGRVVMVTGSGSGIGAATAKAFAALGARVAVVDRNEQAADAIAGEIGPSALAFRADVSNADDVTEVVGEIERRLGGIDTLVNNAGIAERKSFFDLTPEDWRAVLDVNLAGAFYCTQAVARRMVDRGAGGAIVNVASVAGLTGVQDRPAYCASKHGLVGLTRVLALDLAKHGIRVNAVAPGSIDTPLTAPLLARAGARESVGRSHPLGRPGQPDEVASLIVFLASEEARFMTGVAVPVDGGFLAGKRV